VSLRGVWEKNSEKDCGGIMEESWRRSHEGGVIKDESWRRNHEGGIIE
jgi:hypothetical protein